MLHYNSCHECRLTMYMIIIFLSLHIHNVIVAAKPHCLKRLSSHLYDNVIAFHRYFLVTFLNLTTLILKTRMSFLPVLKLNVVESILNS